MSAAVMPPRQSHRIAATLATKLIPAVLGLGLAACAARPNWKAPASPAATAYRRGPQPRTTAVAGGISQTFRTDGQIAADWYRLLGSDSLDRLVDQALTGSPTLAAAQARLEAAGHELDAASGARYPGVDIAAGASRNHANGAQIGISNPLFTNVFDLYTANVSVHYALDLAGRQTRAIEESAARVDYARDRLLGARLTLVDNVVIAALTIGAIDDEIAATRRIVATERNALEVARNRERLGAAQHIDVLRARSTLASTEASLPDLVKALTAARSRLAVLEGKTPQDFEAPAFSLADFTLPGQLPVSLPSSLVHQRPDILAAEANLHVASAAVGVATADLYPQITLSANFGQQGNAAGSMFDSPATVWSIGGSLLYPLFHGHELRNRRAAAVSRFDAAYADYRQAVLAAFAQVGNVLAALEQDARALRARDAALRSAHAGYTIVAVQYRAGAADYTDLLSSESAWQSALVAQLRARADRLQDTVALYQALGGGWWNAADQAHDSTTAAVHAAQQE